MKTTTATLHGTAIRPWDSPELKAIYWAGAHHALTAAIGLYGCKTSPIRPTLMAALAEAHVHYETARRSGAMDVNGDWDALNDAGRAWYSIGASDALTDVLDALPDSVIEHHPGGLKSIQHARRAWIDKNHRLGDHYARKVGLLK